jgi:formylglycine-generating enzyme required for sulfatase activity
MDERSDVYSLGAILFQILTGRLPFEFATFGELVTKLLREDPPAAATVTDGIPEALSDVCAACLARDADSRPEDADAIAKTIRAWQAQSAVEREVEGLVRDAASALGAARERRGRARIRELDRVVASCTRILTLRPGHARAQNLRAEVSGLREQGVRERERGARRMVLARGGVAVLAVAAVVAIFVAGALERKSREAERERDAKAAALLDTDLALRQAAQERDEKSEALDEVLRLSDAKRVRDLLRQADRLWPVHSDVAPAMDAWITRARTLLANRTRHETALAQMCERALQVSGEDRRRAYEQDVARLEDIRQRLEDIAGERERVSGWDADVRRYGLDKAAQALVAERAELESRTRELFSEEDAWRHEVLSDMLREMTVLESQVMQQVVSRLEAASTVRRVSLEDHAEAWTAAIQGVAESESYDGFQLTAQEGLVPLGPDPDTGLFEFAHVGSGTLPVRDPETKQLTYAEDAAVVLVLIPGGTPLLGAQSTDPQGANYDPDALGTSGVREILLSPFFIAKHECTQAQWSAMTGGLEPSRGGTWWSAVTGRDPVEQITWEDCARWLGRHRLALPTEAQWEYACRAGTDTPWITGRDVTRLREVANIAGVDDDDGYSLHAPVGSFAPNAFGLFDVHGNVAEWCQDVWSLPVVAVDMGDIVVEIYRELGQPPPPPSPQPQIDSPATAGSPYRVIRGGSYRSDGRDVRSSYSAGSRPWTRSDTVGVRPAMVIPGLSPIIVRSLPEGLDSVPTRCGTPR